VGEVALELPGICPEADGSKVKVKEFDPVNGPAVQEAWEKVMMTGVSYLLSRY